VFRHVTLPLLRNTLIFVIVVLAIGAFQVFTQVYVITRGGPAHATEVMQLLIYRKAFDSLQMGYASSLSWCLFAAIAVFTAIQMKVFRSQELY
jgi:ABC-type sugar transport system permease subunit